MNSYWIDSCPNITDIEKLDEDITCDVCIIGGGITGITCGYYLTKQGLKVVILEKDLLASKASGNTTAKITSSHGLFYKYLNDSFSKDYAKEYLDANEKAILNIKKIIEEEQIDCDFEHQDSYIFTCLNDDVNKIKSEVEILNSLGYPAEYLNSIPFSKIDNVLAAVKYPNQAQFHPRKYIKGLCNSILQNFGSIYQNTKVYDIKKENSEYITFTDKNKVHSKYVILTTNYPILNVPGFYFLKLYQEKSYIIGVDTGEELFSGMYINNETPSISFRTAIYNNKRLLLIGGSNHKVGAKSDLSDKYNRLEEFSKKLYPNSKVLYRWSTQDSISLDKVPYIGEFSELMPNLYVATGYKKWGMTSSNVAANIICDKIFGNKNNYEDVFLSTRFHPLKNKEEVSTMIKQATTSLVVEKLKIPQDTLSSLSTNQGKIVEIDGHKVGIYKDKNNKIFTVNPVCTHLGCQLSWNNLDKTWDCPCHGSRFDYMGNSIYAPSIKNLKEPNI